MECVVMVLLLFVFVSVFPLLLPPSPYFPFCYLRRGPHVSKQERRVVESRVRHHGWQNPPLWPCEEAFHLSGQKLTWLGRVIPIFSLPSSMQTQSMGGEKSVWCSLFEQFNHSNALVLFAISMQHCFCYLIIVFLILALIFYHLFLSTL